MIKHVSEACDILKLIGDIREQLKKYRQAQKKLADAQEAGEDTSKYQAEMDRIAQAIEDLYQHIADIYNRTPDLNQDQKLRDFLRNLRKGIDEHKKPPNNPPQLPPGIMPPVKTSSDMDDFIQEELRRLRELCDDDRAEGPVRDLDF